MEFAGKVALVTGAASGIGRATAQAFAREGARVFAVDIADEGGRETEAMIRAAGGEATFHHADLAVPAEVVGMVEAAIARYGRLDVLHNNAYWTAPKHALEETLADWQRTLDVCLTAPFLASQRAARQMIAQGGGVIINTASVHSLMGFAHHAAYDAAKGGLLALTRTLAVDFAPHVRVNAVLPGAILTGAWRGIGEEERQRFANLALVRRLGRPEDIAEAVLYLASDRANFVNGTGLVVDGGLIMYMP